MERRQVRRWALEGHLLWLVVLAVAFLLGGGLGLAFGCAVGGEGSQALSQYLTAYLELAAEGEIAIQPILIFWEGLKLPLLALVLGFTALGVVGLPLVLAIRGFSLVYGVTCLCRLLGAEGLLVGGVLFGLTALIAVPALFVLGVLGMEGGWSLLRRSLGHRRSPLPYGGDYFLRCGGCVVAVAVSAVVEWLVVPSLLTTVARLVLG